MTHDLREVTSRVEQLLAEAQADTDPRSADRSAELVRLLMEVYGAGLSRIVEHVREADRETGDPGPRPHPRPDPRPHEHPDPPRPAGDRPPGLLGRLATDPLVGSLLILHDLHPVPLAERVERALDRLRPHLGRYADGLEVLGIDDEGVLRLRVAGEHDACPSSATTVRDAVAHVVEQAAPEISGVQVEGLGAPAAEPAASGAARPAAVIPVASLYRGRPGEATAGNLAAEAGR